MPSDVDATVSVVVPTYQRADLLDRTLAALDLLDPRPAQVVVVSDGSTDDTEARCRAHGVTLLHTDRQGAGGARNAGWRAVDTPVVAFVDDDCRPAPDWLGRLVAPFADPAVALVQGTTVPDGPLGPNDRAVWVTGERGLYESCNIAYRRSALVEVDGFRPDFGRQFGARRSSAAGGGGSGFGEDTDLAWRVRRAGHATAFADQAIVRHHVFPGTFGDVVREEWRRGKFAWLLTEIPELRDLLPLGGRALRPQSAAAQAALAGLGAAVATRRAAPLLATAPYLRWLSRQTRHPATAARRALLDTIGSVSLLTGSVRARTVLL